MSGRFDGWRGRTAALGTMHGKERAFGPPLARFLGLDIVVPHGLDTDALGTFTGEMRREGTPRDAAERKARLAMAATGLPLGLGNEGSFGPHPWIPFLAVAEEVAVLVDDERGIVVTDVLRTERTNHLSLTLGPADGLEEALARIGFPAHAVVVAPDGGGGAPVKGICDVAWAKRALRDACAASPHGRARIEADLRAHRNPTRMRVLRALGTRLARRLATPCPACGGPGWGLVERVPGLPCAACGTPTHRIAAEIDGCPCCGERRQRLDPLRPVEADPGDCSECNP